MAGRKRDTRSKPYVLSIDIGVKNFAYALGKVTEEKKETQRESTGHMSQAEQMEHVKQVKQMEHVEQVERMEQTEPYAPWIPMFNPYIEIIAFEIHDLRDRAQPVNIMKEILKIFTSLFSLYKINSDDCKIYIERQVPRNTKAFGIMYGLIGLFNGMNYSDITVYDPKSKFTNIEYDAKSKEHKKISVQWASSYLKNNADNSLYNKFMAFSKKDDVADCINMLLL